MSSALSEITAYLDTYLRVADVADSSESLNGLQVENRGRVSHVAAAVDACQATIVGAAESGADLMLVHHGLFWGGLEPITGRHGRRVRTLIESGIALYSAHIPLDLHPEVGNNAILGRALGLSDLEHFGDYKGEKLGVAGSVSTQFAEIVAAVGSILSVTPRSMAFGPETSSRVGVISGGGGGMIAQARDAGVDTLITGEGKHHSYFDAEEWGLNVIFAGHYATETVGVKALAEHVARKFELPWTFIDHPTGL